MRDQCREGDEASIAVRAKALDVAFLMNTRGKMMFEIVWVLEATVAAKAIEMVGRVPIMGSQYVVGSKVEAAGCALCVFEVVVGMKVFVIGKVASAPRAVVVGGRVGEMLLQCMIVDKVSSAGVAAMFMPTEVIIEVPA